jgi:hypothetical protein
MRTRVDDAFRDEASRFRLRFQCENCANFAVETATCANGYPNAAHRRVELTLVQELEFCKDFELA